MQSKCFHTHTGSCNTTVGFLMYTEAVECYQKAIEIYTDMVGRERGRDLRPVVDVILCLQVVLGY